MERFDKPIIDEHIDGFGTEDAFFSRTDARGVIQSANETFVRLGEYQWSELSGAPHRIIRHPDMPKAVFHVMWAMLKQGKVFGGYTKNRTATGRYYWVFSIVSPVPDGFLSVRIKPAAKLFHAAQEIYQQIRADEKANGFDPKTAEDALMAPIRALGFGTYEEFMTQALNDEIAAREGALAENNSKELTQFAYMADQLAKLHTVVLEVNNLFDDIRNVPVNLNLAGAHQGDAGDAIQVVASNYAMISDGLRGSIRELDCALDKLVRMAHRGRMGFCSSVVMRDSVAKLTCNMSHLDDEQRGQERQVVNNSFQAFVSNTAADCTSIKGGVNTVADMNTQLRKHLSALAVTRVMCRIEAAALMGSSNSIEGIANRLDEFQGQLSALLDQIANDCEEVAAAIPRFDVRSFAI